MKFPSARGKADSSLPYAQQADLTYLGQRCHRGGLTLAPEMMMSTSRAFGAWLQCREVLYWLALLSRDLRWPPSPYAPHVSKVYRERNCL